MTGKFGTQSVLISYCQDRDFLSNLVFVDEAAFREYYDKDWFFNNWDGDYTTLDELIDEGILGFDTVEVIGT